MTVLDLTGIITFLLLCISYIKSGRNFSYWLFEYSGFDGYMLKCLSFFWVLFVLITRVDWSFLDYQIINLY